MWPIIMQFLRSNVAYVTLPVAAVVGIIGYNLETLLSDRYTPYNSEYDENSLISLPKVSHGFLFYKSNTYLYPTVAAQRALKVLSEPVQDQRFERLEDELLKDPTHVEKLKYKENVLGKNIPPSLQKN